MLRPSSDSVPPPRVWVDKNPDADRRLKAARAALTVKSEELAIPIENILTPDSLRRVAWNPPEPFTVEAVGSALQGLGARAWQVDATAQLIHDAFVDGPQSIEEPTEPVS